MGETVAAYGEDTETDVHELVSETDFEAIVDYYRSCIEAATTVGDEIAIDVTPGRKYMSAIAFQAGIQFGANHVYYFHRKTRRYRGRFYPEMLRTASDLIDFTLSGAWGRLFGLVSPSKMDGEASGVIVGQRRGGRVLLTSLVWNIGEIAHCSQTKTAR